MNREQESLLENLNLIYRLKEQAELLRQESDMLLSGMKAILQSDDPRDIYENMFDMFRTIIPYEICFVLDPDKPGFMKCSASTDDRMLNTSWQVDAVLKKAITDKPIAIFNAKAQPAWTQQSFEQLATPASVLYCPFRVSTHKSMIVFCTDEVGFYTQHHVAVAQRYREFTEQALLSVQAKLSALESERLREEKERVEKTMLHSEKMASLGLLAAGVAHEINNPVAFIKSNIEFLTNSIGMQRQLLSLVGSLAEKETLNADEMRELRSLIQQHHLLDFADDMEDICKSTSDGIRRVTDIVKSLRTFTHTDDDKSEQRIHVNKCLINSLRLVGSELKRDIRLERNFAPDLPLLTGNPGKFNQVVVNLFVNSAQAMPEGGTLSVSSRLQNEAEDEDKYKNGLIVAIEDTGCGINEADLGQIFEPFYTTKPVGQGTGLGLYITFSLIEALGGKISVTSEVNIGTRFEIFFPKSRFAN